VIVTGASSDIGASTARLLHAAGAYPVLAALLLPSVTATEFGGGMFTLGASPRPGMVVQSPDYTAGIAFDLTFAD
jgi:NAD(P)-dependent dehydrogenase (short-subunit alcohol dehydrogenase family)